MGLVGPQVKFRQGIPQTPSHRAQQVHSANERET